jgi:CRP/FNR family transcriptional regulator, cyclic AMP receptor protein
MSLTSLLPYFSRVPLLAALPDEALKRFDKIAEQRHYRRRQVIHFPDQAGDFIYLLCTGRVKLSRVSDQGREVTLALLENTEIFGETGILAPDQPYELMAETVDDSVIAVLRRTDLMTALQESPAAMYELLKLISHRRSIAETTVADLVFLEVPKRLSKLLIKLHDSQGGGNSPSNALMKAKFTHQELANIIGSTRETTTLVLNDFKRRGLIEFSGRKIILKKRAEIEGILRGSAPISEA